MALDVEGLCPLFEIFDMPRAIAFYRDLLGFKVVATSEPGDDCDWALLKLNNVELMLNTAYEKNERPIAPDPARVAAHRDTALFFGCRDLDEAYSQLRARGLEVKEPVTRDYGMRQLSFADPDGYSLCLQWPAA
ncbi:MAG TPA: VOC family protein [Thermoanaerobaculia bacterium]|nr:VOC family protein [Thermoanaerobaculia bacterium]